MANVYEHADYRETLRAILLAKKKSFGRAFTFDKMAKACRLQRTYLSTVLGGVGHLNADQVFDAAHFLGLGGHEYRYLSALHEHERSTSTARRAQLARKIASLREQGLRPAGYVEATILVDTPTPALTAFYLDINAQLVHMFLTVKRYRQNLESVRRTLGLSPAVFRAAFATVERAGLASTDGTGVTVHADTFHLPSTSDLYPSYRQMMRLKALERMQSRGGGHTFSFSTLYSAEVATLPKIQARFLELVDWAQNLTQTGEPTDVFQLNFDLVRWGDDAGA